MDKRAKTPKAKADVTAAGLHGDNPVVRARAMLDLWRNRYSDIRIGQPLTRGRRKSLERLVKALDRLDPAVRALLWQALGGGEEPVDSMKAAAEACLKSTRISRGRKLVDFHYDIAVAFLVRAWEIKHGSSPLTQWQKFQQFAGEVTRDYGAPVPGEKRVRRWVKGHFTGPNSQLFRPNKSS